MTPPGGLTVGGVANKLALTVGRQLESAQIVEKALSLVGHQGRNLGILMATATAGNRPPEWVSSAQQTGKLLQTIPKVLAGLAPNSILFCFLFVQNH